MPPNTRAIGNLCLTGAGLGQTNGEHAIALAQLLVQLEIAIDEKQVAEAVLELEKLLLEQGVHEDRLGGRRTVARATETRLVIGAVVFVCQLAVELNALLVQLDQLLEHALELSLLFLGEGGVLVVGLEEGLGIGQRAFVHLQPNEKKII